MYLQTRSDYVRARLISESPLTFELAFDAGGHSSFGEPRADLLSYVKGGGALIHLQSGAVREQDLHEPSHGSRMVRARGLRRTARLSPAGPQYISRSMPPRRRCCGTESRLLVTDGDLLAGLLAMLPECHFALLVHAASSESLAIPSWRGTQ